MTLSNSSTSNSEAPVVGSEQDDIRRFLKRLAVFAIPMVLYVAFIMAIDPFSFVSTRSLLSHKIKTATSLPLNPCLWKMTEFDRAPATNILLGDSRMMALKTDVVETVAKVPYYNFAYGGGTLREAIDTFWFAAKRVHLERVYLGVNLETYNDYNYTERTKTYPSLKATPALYVVDRTVLRSALYGLYSWALNKDLKVGVPTMDREAFWAFELNEVMASYFSKYVEPVRYREELREVSAYCRAKGIRLVFVVFPTHVDAQNLITRHGLERQNERMRTELAAMATVFDFDYPNALTTRRENFNDPVHTVGSASAELIGEVWGGKRGVARVSSR